MCWVQVVRLVDLLDEAKSRCSATIKERREARDEPIDDEELELSSSAMGYGAVKYADLKNNRQSNYKFSFDDMLNLKGNTAVYLLYAYARICGIIRKSGQNIEDLKTSATLELKHEKELALALHLARFPEVRNVLDKQLLHYCSIIIVSSFLCHGLELLHYNVPSCTGAVLWFVAGSSDNLFDSGTGENHG